MSPGPTGGSRKQNAVFIAKYVNSLPNWAKLAIIHAQADPRDVSAGITLKYIRKIQQDSFALNYDRTVQH